ncbi:hypothetical protein GJ496_004782 [Pomphorhynchus laevis]|nr:hypothetical protein GJ496_004782 [Pomphorhynchus laevis]
MMSTERAAKYSTLDSPLYGTILCFGDGWWSFDDLNNMHFDNLVAGLTLENIPVQNSLWIPSDSKIMKRRRFDGQVTLEAHRQLESLYNLSQLFSACSQNKSECRTFRDIKLGHIDTVHQINYNELESRFADSDHVTSANHGQQLMKKLALYIDEHDGIDIIVSMFKVPLFPNVRYKCLELLSFLLSVPYITLGFINAYPRFLRRLIIICRDHSSLEYRILAMRNLYNLIVTIVHFRQVAFSRTLIGMQLIDTLLGCLQFREVVDDLSKIENFVHLEKFIFRIFIKLFKSDEFSGIWSDVARIRLVNHCIAQIFNSIDHPDWTQSPDTRSNRRKRVINLPVHTDFHLQMAERISLHHCLALIIETMFWLIHRSDALQEHYKKEIYLCKLLSDVHLKYSSEKYKTQFTEVCQAIRATVETLFPEWIDIHNKNEIVFRSNIIVEYNDKALQQSEQSCSESEEVCTISDIVPAKINDAGDAHDQVSELDDSSESSNIQDSVSSVNENRSLNSYEEEQYVMEYFRKKIQRLKSTSRANRSPQSTDAVCDFHLSDSNKEERNEAITDESSIILPSEMPMRKQQLSSTDNLIQRLRPELKEIMDQYEKLDISSLYYQDSDGKVFLLIDI